MLYGRTLVIWEEESGKKVNVMRKEWERNRGPVIMKQLKKSARKFPSSKRLSVSFSEKMQTTAPKSKNIFEDEYPEEFDTGTVD